jgi:Tol biopolymer transport system component
MTRGAFTAVASLLAIGASACSDPAGPADEPPAHILFISTRDGAVDDFGRPLWDIYRMNQDGTGIANLTEHPARYVHVSLSSDGTRIAFTSNRDGCDVWAMDVDGTNLARLTNRDGGFVERCNGWPRWSPDGERLAFATNRENRTLGAYAGLYDVYVMNADGTDPHNVSHALGDDIGYFPGVAGWSPDGRIVIQDQNAGADPSAHRVFVVNADGTDAEPLFNRPGDHSPAWSPDGSKVAFISERDGTRRLYIMNADGSGERPLTTHSGHDWLPGLAGTSTQFEYNPWSPDGTRIAFMRDALEEWGIWVIGTDGSGLRRLTFRPGWFNGWSRSGGEIAYTEAVNTPGHFDNDVFVVNADGTGSVNLTNNRSDDSDAIWVP